jgi:integrase
LLECCHLRVKDIDFATNQIVVRDGKGRKDRVTMLPAAVKIALIAHLERAREQHQADLRHGAGWVELPNALTRKYPNAGRDWGWQWVFPATRFYIDRLTAQRRRHHLHESVLQRAVKEISQFKILSVRHQSLQRGIAGSLVSTPLPIVSQPKTEVCHGRR